jgi:hypothetical protein
VQEDSCCSPPRRRSSRFVLAGWRVLQHPPLAFLTHTSVTRQRSEARGWGAGLVNESLLTELPPNPCVAWRQTGQCSPHGAREPAKDLPCNVPVLSARSGYCEVRPTTGLAPHRCAGLLATSPDFRSGRVWCAHLFLDGPLAIGERFEMTRHCGERLRGGLAEGTVCQG